MYAVSPIYNVQSYSLNNEDLPGTSVSTLNTISTPAIFSSNISQESTLRGFQLHSYQALPDNILQEILIIFQSIQPNQIERWYQLLSKVVAECMIN